ncbi:MAG: GDP-L-fucose synthase [Chitinispirillales bacterium]|jgi:GDP-L-fucose synthase|nr:GDP-L-fucose synthase [Chitinispirillales bacterium]
MEKSAKIFVAGHRGMVGGAILRKLKDSGFSNIITKTHDELDITNQQAVDNFFEKESPKYVFLAAAKVGGIYANNVYRYDFIYQNLMIASNVIEASRKFGVKKLLNLGSSCIYPKFAPQPIKENSLLTGELEQTNEPYAIAKITAIKLCQSANRQYGTDFISAMPTNLYGIGDNYHKENSHVLPALIRRFHEAKAANSAEVVVWGGGTPLREFLFADDIADACLFLMDNYSGELHVNVGSGKEITIKELAETIKRIVGFSGNLVWDKSKPDGTPRKLMDSSFLRNLGWRPKVDFEEGIKIAYDDFLNRFSAEFEK